MIQSSLLRAHFVIFAAFCGFVLSPAISHEAAAATEVASPRELVFLNWPEYVDPDLVSEFEQQFNVKVRQAYFETDEDRDKLLTQTDGRGYDIAVVEAVSLKAYRKRGWLASLDETRAPNLRHIDPRWRTAQDAAVGYGVPYFWGTLGIAYRSDLVAEEMTSWRQLFRPREAIRGRIAMIKNASELVGLALIALGHSANSSDPSALADAEALLLAQRPHVLSYGYISLTENSALVTGGLSAAMVYSGDALMLQEHNENITFVVPEEGTILWLDYLVVLESSRNKDLALAFINFLNQPENAARLAEYVYYPTPNVAAERLLPTEFLENRLIYPDEQTLARSEFARELPPRALRRRANILAAVVR